MAAKAYPRPGVDNTSATPEAWRPSLAQPTAQQPGHSDGQSGCPADRADADRIATLEAENQALREENARSRLILDSATDYAIITLDTEGCVTGWNAGAQRIMGYAEAEILGRSGEVIFTSEDRAEGRFTSELCRAIKQGSATNERWHLRRDGSRFWASGTMMPLLDGEGRPQGFLNILRDRTEAQADMERRELLVAEMNHRIKNTFATVKAVAAQTGRYAPAPADFLAAFGARLLALARSHDMLIRAGWEDAPLHGMVEGALAAYAGEPGRIRIEGTSVLLAANLVVTVSLAFHELATNAAKYGALSVPAGRVDVAWTVMSAGRGTRRVEVVWRERGGPPVRPPNGAASGRNCWSEAWRPAPPCGWTTIPKGWNVTSPSRSGRSTRLQPTPRANQGEESRMSDTGKTMDERIRDRAYALWEREGQPKGRAEEHWRQARSDVEAEDAGSGLESPDTLPDPAPSASSAQAPLQKPASRPKGLAARTTLPRGTGSPGMADA